MLHILQVFYLVWILLQNLYNTDLAAQGLSSALSYGPANAVPRFDVLCRAAKFSKHSPTKSSAARKNPTQSNADKKRRRER